MPLKLILLRHAKSGWDDMSLADHDRTLTDRGVASARLIGTWLQSHGHVPDLILCSDAVRTQQTVNGLVAAFDHSVAIHSSAALYLSGPDTILRHIARQDAATLLVCAHNPGIAELAGRLVHKAPDHPRFDDYPTAATTIITFDVERWADIKRGTCIDFTIPADLR